MSEDNWKMDPAYEGDHTIVEKKPSDRPAEDEPTYTVPVDAKSIRYLTQAYEKLEHQIIGLAETMQRLPVLEQRMMMTEHRFKNIIKDGINTTVKEHLTGLMSGALMDMVRSDAMMGIVSEACHQVFNKEFGNMIESEPLSNKILFFIERYNQSIEADCSSLVEGINRLTRDIEEIKQRIERLERGHGI